MKAFIRGFETTMENRWLLAFLYFSILVFSLALVFPYFSLVKQVIPYRVETESFWGAPTVIAIQELFRLKKVEAHLSATQVAGMGIFGLFGLFLLFLKGAILGNLIETSRPGQWMRHFFETGGQFFFRFFRISIISLIVTGIVVSVTSGALKSGVKVLTDRFDSEMLSIELGIFKSIVVFLVLVFCSLIADFARIETVLSKEKSMLKSYYRALKFSFSRFFSSYILVLSYHILSFLLIMAAVWLHAQIGQISAWMILFVFVLDQIWILGRIFLWVGLYASEIECYDGR